MDVTPFQIALWTTGWGLVSMYAGHRLRIGAEAGLRRQAFRGKIRSIAATVSAARNPLIYEAYKKTPPEIRVLCAMIRDDIWFLYRGKLDATCAAY